MYAIMDDDRIYVHTPDLTATYIATISTIEMHEHLEIIDASRESYLQ